MGTSEAVGAVLCLLGSSDVPTSECRQSIVQRNHRRLESTQPCYWTAGISHDIHSNQSALDAAVTRPDMRTTKFPSSQRHPYDCSITCFVDCRRHIEKCTFFNFKHKLRLLRSFGRVSATDCSKHKMLNIRFAKKRIQFERSTAGKLYDVL